MEQEYLKPNFISKMIQYRQADELDMLGIAPIRGSDSETIEYWRQRISDYWNQKHHPQKALASRVIYVATDNEEIIGFAAGHLTRRYSCEGELQWIDVIPAYRRKGIASELLQKLATWFLSQEARYICVNCAADNEPALRFYKRHGAENLNEHWLIWKDIGGIFNGH